MAVARKTAVRKSTASKPAPEDAPVSVDPDHANPIGQPPYRGAIDNKQTVDELRAASGELVEPTGPGNTPSETDRGLPVGVMPVTKADARFKDALSDEAWINTGDEGNSFPEQFPAPQVKEHLEGVKEYDPPNEPHPLEKPVIVTLVATDGNGKACTESINGDGWSFAGAGDLLVFKGTDVDRKIVRTYPAGTVAHVGRAEQA